MYVYNLQLDFLYKWLEETDSFSINSIEVRTFLKETLDILCKTDPVGVNLFGEYLETKKRLKMKDTNNAIQFINWDRYLETLHNISDFCSTPFEIILYVYSYCGGSHFGNDYGMINDINKIRKNNKLLQITEHNKDCVFNIELKDIQFQKASIIKDEWTLSHKMYKTINTLSELYVVLGQDNLKNKFKNQI